MTDNLRFLLFGALPLCAWLDIVLHADAKGRNLLFWAAHQLTRAK